MKPSGQSETALNRDVGEFPTTGSVEGTVREHEATNMRESRVLRRENKPNE